MSFAAIASIAAPLVGGLISSSGSNKAADVQAKAAEDAAEVQKYMYDQTREDQGPYRDVGANALYRLADHYGLGYGTDPSTAPPAPSPVPGNNRSPYVDTSNLSSPFVGGFVNRFNQTGGLGGGFGMPDQPGWVPQSPQGVQGGGVAGGPYSAGDRQDGAWNSFFTSPDFQFRLDEGIRGIENSMLARGKGLSGNTAKAITGYSGDLASGEWNSYANRLASLAGVGQTATNALSTIGANTAANMGNAALNAGQARGSGYLNQAEGWSNALTDLSGSIGNWGDSIKNNTVYGGSSYSPNVQSAFSSDWWGR